MHSINKKIAQVIALIGLIIIASGYFFSLGEFLWFKAALVMWVVVFCSCCYRLTPLFKMRNPLRNFIQRDAQHLFVFSLTGLFDKKNGPHWLVISNIESIEIRNDELIVHSNNDRQLSVSIPGSQAQLHAYVSRILTATEKHTIVFR
ncbi:hypothetical protein FHG08_13680 [Pseudoalteromonas sp. Scap03]|uniref:hypothetical protein n=1 Tax=unclassified Pseudoalteromonas TaxID=194690 RepID=UPI00110BEBF1|nr:MULTISPECIES: hypothetical protein [unclassified Pseudoalteromonas]NWL16714.1 hypothetical protein [Pseudoalteromonas sp. Scap03]QLE81820.1 hypothetical protein FLM54_09920 [Pseudoalteromonas sp. Scap25]QLE89764.1 hypothetical protein FLM47_09935 [Pseudoalteromonas sp. Scap06]TMP53388.1 hypothetical protein CWB78_14435 [Pseudoalteromonas sp. S1612]TMP67899.1 hypothetical protein CWB76_16130 [Pseudoalteromonas sp. S1609]